MFDAGPNRTLYQLINLRLAGGRRVDPLIIAWDASALEGAPPVLTAGDVDLDPFRVEVRRAGRRVPVTRKEFAVLHVLMSARGGTVSAEQLLEKAWDENADPFTNAIRVTISSLRKKLGEPPVIRTLPGHGYRIEAGGE